MDRIFDSRAVQYLATTQALAAKMFHIQTPRSLWGVQKSSQLSMTLFQDILVGYVGIRSYKSFTMPRHDQNGIDV